MFILKRVSQQFYWMQFSEKMFTRSLDYQVTVSGCVIDVSHLRYSCLRCTIGFKITEPCHRFRSKAAFMHGHASRNKLLLKWYVSARLARLLFGSTGAIESICTRNMNFLATVAVYALLRNRLGNTNKLRWVKKVDIVATKTANENIIMKLTGFEIILSMDYTCLYQIRPII